MRFLYAHVLLAATLLVGAVQAGKLQLTEEPYCVQDSPERHGDIGCSIVDKRSLPGLKEPVFWHIDQFLDGERARAAAGAASVAFEGHGAWWLLSVGPQSNNHHGGRHMAEVKLSPLPQAQSYSMAIISAYIPAGMTSRVHFHSGVEAFYAVDGERCLETANRAYHLRKGDTLVIPTGATMRLVATGPGPRRDIAVVVFDSSKPQTTRLPMEKSAELVSCVQ